MFLNMLKDEFPDVRLNIISKLELVNNGKLNASSRNIESNVMSSHWHRTAITESPTCHRSACGR